MTDRDKIKELLEEGVLNHPITNIDIVWLKKDNYLDALSLLSEPDCETCGGEGKVQGWSGSPESGTLQSTAEDCPECEGSGIQPDCQKPEQTDEELIKESR